MLEMTTCPELLDDDSRCAAPAEISRRDVLESTDGPIEHIGTRCLAGHVLPLFPAEKLRSSDNGAVVDAPDLPDAA